MMVNKIRREEEGIYLYILLITFLYIVDDDYFYCSMTSIRIR